jgi:hypothetical protein
VICKVVLEKLIRLRHGHEVEFTPVTGGSPENDSFFKWTPYGSIRLGVLNDAVIEGLEPGKTYYVRITEADGG